MKRYLKAILIAGYCLASCIPMFSQEVGYARKNLNLTLEVDWNSHNRGEIQWQRSTDGGTTWFDISKATSPSYQFKIVTDGMYRVRVIDEDACEPILMQKSIKVIDLNTELISIAATSADFDITVPDLKGAEVVEYGFCYAHSVMNNISYDRMEQVAIDAPFPNEENFTLSCDHLKPGSSYSIRFYIKTKDGSLLFAPGRITKTLPSILFSSEDWEITQTEITPRFALQGEAMVNNVEVKFGTSKNELKTISNSKDTDAFVYTAEKQTNLTPNTSYLIEVTAAIDGDPTVISKWVKTLPDYSSIEVDNTTTPVAHKIVWDKEKTLHRISPAGVAGAYPRLLRLSPDSILCAYHAGTASDEWQHIYTQLSTDNGLSWQDPVIVLDKDSDFGDSYWRFTNPELVKLQNGEIIMSLTANGKPETNENCHVLILKSKDNARSWSAPIIVGRGRSWEPMIIQLPNGELELYVSSEAQWWQQVSTMPQEILFSRSTDMGETWTTWERASYSPDRRDGMPVAVLLQGNKGVAFSIEIVNDKGYGSPSVVKRDLDKEWDATPWDGKDSNNRYHVDIDGHGGGPHMIQLPTGEVVLQAHLGGRNGNWKTSYPRVVIGDNNASNFGDKTYPLGILPEYEGAYYNSLFLKDSETIWLVVSKTTYSGNTQLTSEIRYLEGKIVEK